MWSKNDIFKQSIISSTVSQVIYIFVAHDQTCEVPSRYIGENVALLRDVATYANELSLFVATLSLDQEKAIDRVDCSLPFSYPFVYGLQPLSY